MLKEFDEFLSFCFVHGGTLRNHKQFGEMARELRAQIEAAEQQRAPDGALVVRDSSGVVTCSVCGTGLGVE